MTSAIDLDDLDIKEEVVGSKYCVVVYEFLHYGSVRTHQYLTKSGSPILADLLYNVLCIRNDKKSSVKYKRFLIMALLILF